MSCDGVSLPRTARFVQSSRIWRFLTTLVGAVLFAGAALAQSPVASSGATGAAPASPAALLQQAQQAVSAPLDNFSLDEIHRLTQLRERVAHLRDLAGQKADAGTLETRILQAQIAAFGPIPAIARSEPAAVTARRQALDHVLSARIGPVLAARETAAAASTLVRELDARLRRMRHHRLFSYNDSPLDPRVWVSAVTSISQRASEAGQIYAAAWHGPNAKAVRRQAIEAAVLIVLGTVIGAWLLRMLIALIDRRIAASPSPPKRLLYNLLRDVVGAVLLTVAILATWVAVALILESVMPQAVWVELTRTLIISSLVAMIAGWLGPSILLSPFPELRIVRLDDADAHRGRTIILLLGIVVALETLFSLLEERAWTGSAFANLVSATIVLGGGWLLLQLTALFRRRHRPDGSAANADGAAVPAQVDTLDFVGPINRVIRVVVFISVAAALLGFVMLARSVLVSTIVSLAVIAIAVYLQSSIRLVLTLLAQGPLNRYRGVIHLLPILSGLVLTLLTLPLLAVIWGYQSTEIVDALGALRTGISIGDVKFSAGDVLTFGIVFLVGYIATRWVQRILRASVLPQFALDIGARSALVTIAGYVGIVLAAIVAIATTGLDFSSLAFVFGALSVGLGFGLQSVVENFTSGVILLLERPVREGDSIEVGDHSGVVRKISVRSTRLETADRHYIIIPNSQLITGAVKNLSLGGEVGRISVPASVGYASDLDATRALLIEIAKAHKLVLRKPAPFVTLDGFGDSAIELNLFCFVADVTTGAGVQSDLRFTIAGRFREQGIEIPFPQRDIRFRNDLAINSQGKD